MDMKTLIRINYFSRALSGHMCDRIPSVMRPFIVTNTKAQKLGPFLSNVMGYMTLLEMPFVPLVQRMVRMALYLKSISTARCLVDPKPTKTGRNASLVLCHGDHWRFTKISVANFVVGTYIRKTTRLYIIELEARCSILVISRERDYAVSSSTNRIRMTIL